MQVLCEEKFWTDHSQYSIYWNKGWFDESASLSASFEGQRNGLLGAAIDSGVIAMCVTQYGPVKLRVEHLEEEPGPAADLWDDVVEVSVQVAGWARLSPAQAFEEEEVGLALLSGIYRARFARLELDVVNEDDDPREEHLIQFWSTYSLEGDAIIRERSKDAQWCNRNRIESNGTRQ